MKKLFVAFVLVLGMLSLTGCGKVPAGNVGIKVYLLGDDKGVDQETLSPGRYWVTWNQELYIFPTFTQNTGWTAGNNPELGSETDESISFQSREGMTVSADIGLSYSIDPEKVPQIFQKYRRGIEEITDTYLRNMIRDAFVAESSRLPVESVYGEGKTALIAAVEKNVRDQVEPIGIKIERIYWIGELRLPPQVVTAINDKLQATQKAQQRQNEVAQSRAEADKKIEEARGEAESLLKVAEAQAKANKLLAESLSEPLVKWEQIKKWDGVMPKVSGGGAGVLLDAGDLLNDPKPETQP